MVADNLQGSAGASPHDEPDVPAADASLLARHAELVAIDNVIGLEATVARLEFDLKKARERVKKLKNELELRDAEIAAIRRSRTWRAGRILTGPFSRRKG
jgi:hypothetical protein